MKKTAMFLLALIMLMIPLAVSAQGTDHELTLSAPSADVAGGVYDQPSAQAPEPEKPGPYKVNPDAAEDEYLGTWLFANIMVFDEDGTSHLYGFDSDEPLYLEISSGQAKMTSNPPKSGSAKYQDGRLYFGGELENHKYCEMTYGGHLFIPLEEFTMVFNKVVPEEEKSDTQKLLEAFFQAAAAQEDYQKGLAYLNGDGVDQDYEQAHYWWTKAAEHGNVDAMYNLGVMYALGEAVAQDYGKAAEWYQKAADAGNMNAQNNLGNFYEKGFGVEQDYEQAVYWYRKAAEQGLDVAKNNLGQMYDYGVGVEKDPEQAVYWYQQAAESGNADAQYNLAAKYITGVGVEQDPGKALEWYQKSAAQDYAPAYKDMGLMYELGLGVEQDYAQAAANYQKGADLGYDIAQTYLGVMYENGRGVEQDYAQAMNWYQKAAEAGNAEALFYLGNLYYFGKGTEPDPVTASQWYQKAAEAGHAIAQSNLGYLYNHGEGVEQDNAQAFSWYQKSAEQGFPMGQSNLGYCYEVGQGVEQDYAQALYWYQLAADQGDAAGQCGLGHLYENGWGVEQDPEQAKYWYQLSADQGYEEAVEALEQFGAKVRIAVSDETAETGKIVTVTVTAPGADAIRLYDSLSSDPEKPRKEVEGDTLEYRRMAVKATGEEGESYWAAASFDGVWSDELSITKTIVFVPASKLRVNCPETANAGEALKLTIYETADTEAFAVRVTDEAGSAVLEKKVGAGTLKLDPLSAGKYTLTVARDGDEARALTFSIDVK